MEIPPCVDADADMWILGPASGCDCEEFAPKDK